MVNPVFSRKGGFIALLLCGMIFSCAAMPVQAASPDDFAQEAVLNAAGKPENTDTKISHTFEEWKRLAEAGDTTAQSAICNMGAIRAPAPAYYDKFVAYCLHDANEGNVTAELLLSHIYATGGGTVAQNIEESYYWFIIGMKNPVVFKKAHDILASKMDPARMQAIEKRAAQWKADFCTAPGKQPGVIKTHCTDNSLPANAAPIDVARDAYHNGDYKKAFDLAMPLAQQGNAAAENMVGQIYHAGLTGELDWNKAAEWYRKAVDQNYAPAELFFGQMLDSGKPTKGPSAGKGVDKNQAEAFALYRKAAEQGYAEAYGKIALTFYNGIVVPKDLVEAFGWQSLSLAAHSKDGPLSFAEVDKMFLRSIVEKLPVEDQDAAKKRAAELQQKYLALKYTP